MLYLRPTVTIVFFLFGYRKIYINDFIDPISCTVCHFGSVNIIHWNIKKIIPSFYRCFHSYFPLAPLLLYLFSYFRHTLALLFYRTLSPSSPSELPLGIHLSSCFCSMEFFHSLWEFMVNETAAIIFWDVKPCTNTHMFWIWLTASLCTYIFVQMLCNWSRK